MTGLPVTSLYAAVLGLLMVPFSISVVRRRFAAKVSLGHGNDEVLLRRVRAHANFIEYVPMAVVLIALTELQGADAFFVHALGSLLVAARIVHYVTLTTNPRARTRAAAMIATFAVYVAAAGWLLYAVTFR